MTKSAVCLSVTIAETLLIGCQSNPEVTDKIGPLTGQVDYSAFDKLALESPQVNFNSRQFNGH